MDYKYKLRMDNEINRQIEALLELVWQLSEDQSIQEIADSAGLCYSTVYRLYRGEWKRPQTLTILKLSSAVGLVTTFKNESVYTSLKAKK